MKTNNKIPQKIAQWIVLISAATMLSACPGKNNDSPAPGPVVGTGGLITTGCTNCANLVNPQLIYHGVASTQVANYDLNFLGNGNVLTTTRLPWALNYSGVAAVAGFIDIKIQANNGRCQMAPGRYTVQTVQAGNWSNLAANGYTILAVGPSGTVSLYLATATLPARSPNGDYWSFFQQQSASGNFLTLEMRYDSVNQVSCGGERDVYYGQ